MGLASELQILRAKRRISLQKLSDAVSVSKTHLWQLEKGTSTGPSLEVVTKLADFFNVSIQSLVGENPESENANQLAVAMFRKVGELDEIDQIAINQMIDTMMDRKKKREYDIQQRSSK